MNLHNKKIVIISPNKNAYSETFIQMHRKMLQGKVEYLYDDFVPKESEKEGALLKYYYTHNYRNKLYRLLPSFIYERKIGNKLDNVVFLEYYLKHKKIDVVLAEYGITGAKLAPICAKLNIKLITHFHGFDASVYSVLSKYKREYNYMFFNATKIIAVSKVMYNQLLKLGCPEDKLILNHYGPNPIFFERVQNKISNHFIAVGRFTDKKAPYYTILAFNEVLKKHPSAKLTIAGDGELFDVCNNLINALGLNDSVNLPGAISPEDLSNLFENSIAFVQHSITAKNGDMEGTPLAVLESGAANLPVISTIHAGIPDVVIHGETGFLVNEHDYHSMAEYMIKLLDNPQLAKQMGTKARKRIESNFNIEKHISIIQDIIDNS